MEEPIPEPETPPEIPSEPASAPPSAEVPAAPAVPESAPVAESAEVVVETPQVAAPPAAETIPQVEIPASEPRPSPVSESTAPEPAPAPTPAPSAVPVHLAKENSLKAVAKKKQKIEKHLEKILAAARSRASISNRDVVKLLRVSDATASRYLKMLVSRGHLQKMGKGRSVKYILSHF